MKKVRSMAYMSAMAMVELSRLEMPTATIRLVTLRIGDGNNPKQLTPGQAEGDTSPAL